MNIINLEKKEIRFERNGFLCHLISYDKTKMIVEVKCYEKEKLIKNEKIVFAQVPKSIKKLLNPL